MEFEKRKRRRLKDYDYSKNGIYFVTLCIKNRKNILSKVVGQAALCLPEVELTNTGKIVKKYIQNINDVYNCVTVDKYVIMPNHIHMLLFFNRFWDYENGRQGAACPTLSNVVRSVKIMVQKEIRENIFQTSFYDRIIRNEKEYQKIWEYIDTNPLKWEKDFFYNMSC